MQCEPQRKRRRRRQVRIALRVLQVPHEQGERERVAAEREPALQAADRQAQPGRHQPRRGDRRFQAGEARPVAVAQQV